MPGHVWYVCKKDSSHNEFNTCFICDGGLALCTLCGAFEGQLLTYCPGYMLSEETLDACYKGNVIDFCRMHTWVKHGYNIRKKTWK